MNCNLRFMSCLVELIFDYKLKGWLKLFVDATYSVKEFIRKLFVLSLIWKVFSR